MKPRHPFFAAVYLYIKKHDSILIARRINTGYADGQYSLVAGHIEAGESAYTALQREVKEEAGIDVSIADLRVVHVMHRNANDSERFDIFIEARHWTGEPYIAEPEKCDDMQWCLPSALPSNTVDYVIVALDAIERGQAYSEYGWEKD